MNRRITWACLPVAFAVLAAGATGALARSDVPLPPDLLDASRYPGLREILELDGKNVHSCGNVLLHITNFGLIGSRPGARNPFESAPSAQWPAGGEAEYLWSAGLWIGAEKEAEKVVTTGQFAFEFRPGLTELDRIYVTRDLAPGGARAPAPNADDDGDKKTDEDWLDGRDNDGDGRIDEDFAGISNQMFFSEYTDTDPNIKLANPEHTPIGFKVQQSSLCWEDRLIDDFIAFDYKLINPTTEPIFNVYIGLLADCDIGPRTRDQVSEDDWAGFWEGILQARLGLATKNVKVSIGYMFDDDGDEGKSEGYIGLMFLGAQDPGAETGGGFVSLRNYRFFSGSASFEQGGDPGNDEERYRVLDGTAPKSLPPANPVTGLRGEQLSKKKDDYRMVVSAGPFAQVDPGDTLGFQAALVIGHFFDGMVENAVQAQLTYDGVYLDCDEDPSTGLDNRETRVCGPAQAGQNLRINPCDSLCDFAPPSDPECFVNVPAEGCEWINADCLIEQQTGFPTGELGKECLIHWLVSTAPPPPRMRLVGRENQIDVLWDNFSETTPDLRLNVIDFESYRIWRADNWKRPLGTDVNTGPGSNLWMLLAEFDLPRNIVGSNTGIDQVRYTPNIADEAVEFYREWFAAHPFLDAPNLPGYDEAQLDTAKALSRGTRYYRYTDPPFKVGDCVHNPDNPSDCVTVGCAGDGSCPPVVTSKGEVLTRCNGEGMCQEVRPAPHSGAHYFYSVTATDHKLDDPNEDGVWDIVGPGLAGDPSSNFVYSNPPTNALAESQFDNAADQIYVVPNPATVESLSDWQLQPNNDDPTGIKIEFHHLPKKQGMVTIYTLSGDMVIELPFDGTAGDGSLAWNLLSRNGQEITSGVYLYSVTADGFDRFVSKFAVIR